MSTHRRFWQAVSVLRREDGAYEVRLDGRPIRLPGGGTVAVPARSLADAIAAEWSAIEPRAPFVPTDLPLTRIAGTMIERIAPNPDSVKETLLEYGLSDLLACRDPALADRQAACFDPILARFADHWGVSPRPTVELSGSETDPDAVAAFRSSLNVKNAAALAALGVIVPATGSLILGLGLVEGWISGEEALEAAFLDERAQMARWGEDHELLALIAVRGRDVTEALRFWALSSQAEKTEA